MASAHFGSAWLHERPPRLRLWLPSALVFGALAGMGAKYLPTVKDLKASQRFQRKQAALIRPTKAAGSQAAKPVKKK